MNADHKSSEADIQAFGALKTLQTRQTQLTRLPTHTSCPYMHPWATYQHVCTSILALQFGNTINIRASAKLSQYVGE